MTEKNHIMNMKPKKSVLILKPSIFSQTKEVNPIVMTGPLLEKCKFIMKPQMVKKLSFRFSSLMTDMLCPMDSSRL